MKWNYEKILNSVFTTGLLFSFYFIFGIVPGWKSITSDFPNYYVSSKMVLEKKDLSCLYDNTCFNKEIKKQGIEVPGQFALYPPLNAFLFLPLSNIEPLAAKRVWLILNALLIVVCACFIKKISGMNFVFSLNVLLLSGFALTNDLFLGQVYLLLTTLMLGGLLLFTHRSSLATGICWAIVTALKYVPVVFFPALILKRKWKLAGSMLLALLFFHACALPWFKIADYKLFLSSVFFPHLQGSLYEGRPFSVQYQSWDALLNNLFVFDGQFNPHPLFNFPAGYFIFKSCAWVIVTCILLYFYMKSFHSPFFFEIIFSLSVTSLLILEPGSATYHNLLLIFPVTIILKLFTHTTHKNKVYLLLFLFSLIGFLPAILNKVDVFHGQNLFLSFHRLWLEILFYGYLVYLLRYFKEINFSGSNG